MVVGSDKSGNEQGSISVGGNIVWAKRNILEMLERNIVKIMES